MALPSVMVMVAVPEPTRSTVPPSETFTTDDYAALVAAMFDGTITVSNDITKKPADFATDITLTDLGTLN